MIIDKRLQFSTAGTIATATGRALHGDVVDLGVAGAGTVGAGVSPGDLGVSAMTEGLAVVFNITTAVTSAGAATISFEVVTDAQAAIAVDGSATLHAKTEDIAKTTLVVGYTRKLPLPPQPNTYERYLGVITNVGTAALTGGALSAWISRDVGSWVALPDAVV